MNLLLNSVVAYQTLKTVNKLQSGDSDTCVYENKHTREKDRMEMCLCFMFGILLAGTYLFIPEISGFFDFFYLCFYVICQMAVLTVSWNDKQNLKNRRYSWVLSALLAIIMLVPFILDMDSIYVHQWVASTSFAIGEMTNTTNYYHDYTDYGQVLCIGFMVVWCLLDVLVPMYKLYKSKDTVCVVKEEDDDVLKTLLFMSVILIAIAVLIAVNVKVVSCEEVGIKIF